MKKIAIALASGVLALMGGIIPASADLIFVGSWEVDQGPFWTTQPPAYTGQEAAALLFGGTPGEYAISTVDSNPADVNFEAWYSVLGYGGPHDGGIAFAENYVAPGSDQAPGYYYSGGGYTFGDVNEAASAYVSDNAGPGNINYAFINAVPEPTTLALVGTCLAGAVAWGRRRKLKTAK